MCEDSQCSHRCCASPSIRRIIAVLPAVRDSQEDVPRTKGLPNVKTETVQPEEGCQEAEAQDNVRHNEAHMAGQLGENSYKVCCLAYHKAHGYRCHNVTNQISAEWIEN